MRIFYAVEFEPRLGSRLWYNNLFLPLVDLGHEVLIFDYPIDLHSAHLDPSIDLNRIFIKQNRPRLEEALLNQIEKLHRMKKIDVFFSYFYSSFVRPEVIHEIRQMGIVTLNWYCNASYQFDLVKDIAPAYDYCLVPEKFRLDDYRRVGANPIYCQEAANPKFYKHYTLPREYDVTFVGAQYGDRAEYVRYMLDQDIDIRVWGPYWKNRCPPDPLLRRLRWWAGRRKRQMLHQPYSKVVLPRVVCGAPLPDEEMVQMYSRSKISLGFSNVGETHLSAQPIKQVRLRDFEAPMSGAFYMVEYMEELENFFEPDKEIVFYYDKADLADKIKYYLRNESEREAIRQAGYKRAVNEHSWQHRFEMVFKTIGLG